jgi:D-arabinose 1-dehydrogenase-like Zn-dependent alcohol dehydrogenase
MCSGVTLYDPMKRFGVGPGTRVGIIGECVECGRSRMKAAMIGGITATQVREQGADGRGRGEGGGGPS